MVSLVGINTLSGQTIDSKGLASSVPDLSVAPEDRVVDFGEIFSVGSTSRRDLSRRLEALNDRYDFSVYYIAYSGIIGSDVDEKAGEFRDLWLGAEKEGLVFVCDTDMKRISCAFTKVDSLPLDGSSPGWQLPDYEALDAVYALYGVDPAQMSEEEYLTTIGLHLVDELERRLVPQPITGKGNWGGILGTIVVASGLIGLGVWWAQKQIGATSGESEEALFPTIEIPSRLGAHFGGGRVCEISFTPPSSSTTS